MFNKTEIFYLEMGRNTRWPKPSLGFTFPKEPGVPVKGKHPISLANRKAARKAAGI
jgi:hypothetical protein